MARLKGLTPGDALGYHEELEKAAPDALPAWTRYWIMDAITAHTVPYEQYRKMEWDLDEDIRKAVNAFQPAPGKSPAICPACGHGIKGEFEYQWEDVAFDLRQIWRRLRRRYAFRSARAIENKLWEVEKRVWGHAKPEEKRMRGHPYLFRLWRWKDLLLCRLFLAVLAGFVLVMSSSGLVKLLRQIDCLGLVGWAAGGAMVFAYGLALVEVQRRIGRRRWLTDLCRRAAVVTAFGAGWAVLGAVLVFLAGGRLGLPVSIGFAALWAASALVLGFLFQLFWQENSIAEPL